MRLKHATFNQRVFNNYDSGRDEMTEAQINFIKRSNRNMMKYIDEYSEEDQMGITTFSITTTFYMI